MKFLAASLFALTALAAPAANEHQLSTRAQAMEASLSNIHSLQASGCSILKCVTALAPAFVGCAAAAAEEFVNPVADISCIASAVNDGVNPPAACVTCFQEIKNNTLGRREPVEQEKPAKRKVYLPLNA